MKDKDHPPSTKLPWWYKFLSIGKDPVLKKFIKFYYENNKSWGKENDLSQLFDRILNIYLSKTQIKDILIPWGEVDYIDIENSFEETIEIIRKTKHSRYPVIDRDSNDVLGSLHVKDLLIKENVVKENGIKNILRDIHIISDNMDVLDALKYMKDKRAHLLIIMGSASQSKEGIVTMEDILELIFGDIIDEFDAERVEKNYFILSEPRKKYYIIKGDTPLEYLTRKIRIKFPENILDEVDTISGLLMFLNNYNVPDIGKKLYYENWEFEVRKAQLPRIEEVIIRKR